MTPPPDVPLSATTATSSGPRRARARLCARPCTRLVHDTGRPCQQYFWSSSEEMFHSEPRCVLAGCRGSLSCATARQARLVIPPLSSRCPAALSRSFSGRRSCVSRLGVPQMRRGVRFELAASLAPLSAGASLRSRTADRPTGGGTVDAQSAVTPVCDIAPHVTVTSPSQRNSRDARDVP